MKITDENLMKLAIDSLKGNWVLAILTFLIYELLIGGIQQTSENYSVLSLVFLVISGPITLGVSIFSLNLSRNLEPQFENLLEGFNNFKTSLFAYLLISLFVILWLLLLIIPGIIAVLSYSMTFYIIADDNSINATGAIDKSKKMMEGHKIELFILGLKFFGLSLLCLLTLGIGFLWLIPFANVTLAKFYDAIKLY
ncbi:MAG: hypothetical protein COC22_06600 [Flavobacteriaceae bacterium]|nr:MAG: hypothetical protein COC22_06600 [Flavobacteriaceae bacterium]